MKGQHIRWVVIWGIVAIVGIVVTQVYWVRKAFDSEQRQLAQSIHIALKNVAQNLAEFNKSTLASTNPVNPIATDYYIVNVNDEIDANILEYYLKTEFGNSHLNFDFEYGIYDCGNDEMVYGDYVNFDKQKTTSKPTTTLPKWHGYDYYFGVKFPTLSTHLANQMGIWIFSSTILLLVIIFFGYTLFIILKQKRLSEIQKDFINNMTHEFKTPISTIAISAEVLSNPNIIEQPSRLANYANIIKKENLRLKNQVEKVLQMARIDKEKLKLKLEKVDLHELILHSVENFDVKVEEKGGKTDYQLNGINYQIKADTLHLTNMIYNLIDNAIKYSEDSPQITISTENQEDELLFCIADKGIGIDKSYQKRIFDKFFRVPTGDVHNVKGFGLGLNYVAIMVKAHKWNIDVESEIGVGSTFCIRIPIMKPSVV